MSGRYGSRKFLMAVGGLIGLHWALWAGLIGAAEYKVLLPVVLAAYQVTNVWQKKDEQKALTP